MPNMPWLSLKGIFTGEMGAALGMLLDPKATGLSVKTISPQKGQSAADYPDWCKVDLTRGQWVYIWADRPLRLNQWRRNGKPSTAGCVARMTGSACLLGSGSTPLVRSTFWLFIAQQVHRKFSE